MTSIAYAEIEGKVRMDAKGEWEKAGMLRELRSWGRDVVGGWWEGFYAGESLASFRALALTLTSDFLVYPTRSRQY